MRNCKRKKNWRSHKFEQNVLSKMIRREKRRELKEYIKFLSKSNFNIWRTFKKMNSRGNDMGPIKDEDGVLQYDNAYQTFH